MAEQLSGLDQLFAADTRGLPRMADTSRSPLKAGVSAGVDQLQALGYSALGGLGELVGSDTLKNFGNTNANANFLEAQSNGRMDLEGLPGPDGPAIVPWLGYQAAKQVPNLALQIAASRIPGMGRLVPEALEVAGAAVPRLLGGGGMRAGMTAAEQAVAQVAGKDFARSVVGATVAGQPLAFGSMYSEAVERGDPTQDDALKALGLSLPYAALDSLEPAQLKGLVTRGASGGVLKRVLTAGLAGAAQEIPTEAAQTALELSFRPDISTRDKMSQIVEAAVTGGAVGGLLGGMGGLRRMKAINPADVTDTDLKSATDAVIAASPAAAGPRDLLGVAPQVEAPIFDAKTRAPRPLAGETTEDLVKAFATIEQTAARSDKINPDTAVLRGQLRAELDVRAQTETAGPPVPEEPTLFGRPASDIIPGSLRDQTAGETTGGLPVQLAPGVAPPEPLGSPGAIAARGYALKIVGGKPNRFTQTLEADDVVSVADQVLTQLTDRKDWPTWLVTAGQNVGLIDAQGEARNLSKEIVQAEKKLDTMQQRAKISGSLKEANAYGRTVVTPLREQAEVVKAVMARRAEAAATPPLGATRDVLQTAPQNTPLVDTVVQPEITQQGMGLDQYLRDRQGAGQLTPQTVVLGGQLPAPPTVSVAPPPDVSAPEGMVRLYRAGATGRNFTTDATRLQGDPADVHFIDVPAYDLKSLSGFSKPMQNADEYIASTSREAQAKPLVTVSAPTPAPVQSLGAQPTQIAIPAQPTQVVTPEPGAQAAAGGQSPPVPPVDPPVGGSDPEGPPRMDAEAGKVMQLATTMRDAMSTKPWSEWSDKLNQAHLYATSVEHIAEYFKGLFPPDVLGRYAATHHKRVTIEQKMSHLALKPYHQYEKLLSTDKKAADAIGKLMGYSYHEIDPKKDWDAHTWLHETKNADVLRQHVAEANRNYNSLRQRGMIESYLGFAATNEAFHYAQQALALHNQMATDPAVGQDVKDKLVNPIDEFQTNASVYDSPQAARDYWLKQTTDMVAFVKQYVTAQRGLPGTSKVDLAKINGDTSELLKQVKAIESEQEAMQQAPYFHIPRFGEWFVAFNLRVKEDKSVDPVALNQAAEAFEKAGLTEIEIPTGSNRDNVFIRFETEAQAIAATEVIKSLQAKGFVRKDVDAKHGKRSFDAQMDRAPLWQGRLVDDARRMSAYDADDPTLTKEDKARATELKKKYIENLQKFMINMLPDKSQQKVMVHRNSVPGFSADMVRGYAHRTQIGGRAIASLYASSEMTDTLTGIRQAISAAQVVGGEKTPRQAFTMQNVFKELLTREALRPTAERHSGIDTLRAFNHAYFLGMSPSYVLVNMTQVPVLLWPELSKKYGFVHAARTIGRVTPIATKILAATISEGRKAGWKQFPDATITKEALQKAGVPPATVEFVLRVVNTGVIDIGSQSREQGRIADGAIDSKKDLTLKYAAAMGYYSEMYTRVIAALAARELHGGTGLDMYKYVDATVTQSMLNQSSWNVGRATGKLGLAGPLTQVMTSFMQYTFQLTEKLYREVGKGFIDGAATDAEKKEARRFIGAHLAAVTTVAGSLGMPMASVFAKVIESMVDILGDDDEPYNAKAAYRNFLSDVFGKGVGEVIARGLPRAFGVDMSQRAGEADILPFTKVLTDRRAWDEKMKDWALDTMGSPVSMIGNVLIGGQKIAQGNVMSGLKDLVPVALKGPIEAYKMSEQGYTDAKGNGLPMSVGANDILTQLMGFAPAEKAEYSEARLTQISSKGQMMRQASLLRKQLATAIEQGDNAGAKDLIKKTRAFDERNPDYAVLPGISGTLKSRAKERARAEQLNAPLGTPATRAGDTRFANFE